MRQWPEPPSTRLAASGLVESGGLKQGWRKGLTRAWLGQRENATYISRVQHDKTGVGSGSVMTCPHLAGKGVPHFWRGGR